MRQKEIECIEINGLQMLSVYKNQPFKRLINETCIHACIYFAQTKKNKFFYAKNNLVFCPLCLAGVSTDQSIFVVLC